MIDGTRWGLEYFFFEVVQVFSVFEAQVFGFLLKFGLVNFLEVILKLDFGVTVNTWQLAAFHYVN